MEKRIKMITRQLCLNWDAEDSLAHYQQRFSLPQHCIYLDGPSLLASEQDQLEVDQDLYSQCIADQQRHGLSLMDSRVLSQRVTEKIASMLGADREQIILTDRSGLTFLKLLSAMIHRQAQVAEKAAKVIVAEKDALRVDVFSLEAYLKLKHPDYRLVLVNRLDDAALLLLQQAIALVMVSHVHACTAYKHDMKAINQKIHQLGALSLWELSYSVGAMEIDLCLDQCDFAMGQSSNYLNAGRDGPAFFWADPQLDAPSFQSIAAQYPTHALASHFKCLKLLNSGVEIIANAEIEQIRDKSLKLSDVFMALMQQQCAAMDFELMTPMLAQCRGSHISYRHAHAHHIVHELLARGVVVDLYATDILRFGLAPLYLSFEKLWIAIQHLRQVMLSSDWRKDQYFDYAV